MKNEEANKEIAIYPNCVGCKWFEKRFTLESSLENRRMCHALFSNKIRKPDCWEESDPPAEVRLERRAGIKL